MMEGLSANIN